MKFRNTLLNSKAKKYYIFFCLLQFSLLSFAQTENCESAITKVNKDSTELFFAVEKMPILEYKNCKQYSNCIHKYVQDKLKLYKYDCKGIVFAQFMVNCDGTVSDIRIKRGIDNCEKNDSIAIKIITDMPPLKPAIKKGVPVKIPLSIPIRFE